MTGSGTQPEITRVNLRTLPALTLLLSIIGLSIASYLTFTHFQEDALVCNISGGCHTVQDSQYSTIGPIPIALLGVGMFLTTGALALARVFRWSMVSTETANLVTWGITLAALLYYAYLTYVELFVLEAICQWCVGSSIATLGIFLTESVLLWRNFSDDMDDMVEESA